MDGPQLFLKLKRNMILSEKSRTAWQTLEVIGLEDPPPWHHRQQSPFLHIIPLQQVTKCTNITDFRSGHECACFSTNNSFIIYSSPGKLIVSIIIEKILFGKAFSLMILLIEFYNHVNHQLDFKFIVLLIFIPETLKNILTAFTAIFPIFNPIKHAFLIFRFLTLL